MKKYRVEVELQSSELNLGLRRTAMIVTGTVCNKVVFAKYCPDFKVFFSKIMHKISNIIFQVMSYMDGDFNNSRK